MAFLTFIEPVNFLHILGFHLVNYLCYDRGVE